MTEGESKHDTGEAQAGATALPAGPKGPELTDPEERLYRQVHPSWVQEGRPSSQAFRPTRKDAGMLSVSRGSVTTPSKAHHHHTVTLGLASAGVWSVSVGDCHAAELRAHADPIDEPIPDPAHAVVDYRGLATSAVQRRAMSLQQRARLEFGKSTGSVEE